MNSYFIKRRALIWSFVFVTSIYIMSMIYFDKQLDFSVFDRISLLDACVIFSLFMMSILFRYYRWHLLMKQQGVDHKLLQGLLFYVSGFAYTATPGKVGELSRVFFYNRIKVPSYFVVSSFVIERFFDLIVVLLMAGLLLLQFSSLHIVAYFICLIILAVIFFIYNKKPLKFVCNLVRKAKIKKLSRLSSLFYLMSKSMRSLINTRLAILSFILGFTAWSCTSFILVYVCSVFQLDISVQDVYAIYPTAMLAGAVSFIPGGLGATEAVIVFLLDNFNISFVVSSAIAILVRFSTLWLAMLFGMCFSLLSSFYFRRISE